MSGTRSQPWERSTTFARLHAPHRMPKPHMNRLAVLVDAGYLLSQSVHMLSDQKSKARKDVVLVNAKGLIDLLIQQSLDVLANRNLLRLYWYDGVSSRMSADHEALAELPDVQFRTGTISKSGQQKGVDSRIMADLIELSANKAISDAVLVTGDGDLVVAIDLAQRQGVRIAIIGLEEPSKGTSHNQSFEMVCAVDRIRRIGVSDIAPFMAYKPAASPTREIKKVASTKSAASRSSPEKAPERKATTKKTPAKKSAAPAKKTAAPKRIPVTDPALPSLAEPTPKVVGVTTKVVPQLEQLPAIVRQFIANASPRLDKSAVTPTGVLDNPLDAKLREAATEALLRKPTRSERVELSKLLRNSL